MSEGEPMSQDTKRHKSDTIKAMGLRNFMEDRYGEGAYDLLDKLFRQGKPDGYIAEQFSTPVRKVTYQNVSNWRKHYVQ